MVTQNGLKGEGQLERGISSLLIVGVIVSLALEAAGIFLFYRASHGVGIRGDASAFLSGRNYFTFLADLVHQALSGAVTGMLLMTLGVTVLILTPYLRVVLSVYYFGRTRNLKYLAITLFVFAVLTVSLLAH